MRKIRDELSKKLSSLKRKGFLISLSLLACVRHYMGIRDCYSLSLKNLVLYSLTSDFIHFKSLLFLS